MPESTAVLHRESVSSRAYRAASVLCALLSAGCATTGISWKGAAVAPRVDVFYATDRDVELPDGEQGSSPASQAWANPFAGDRGAGPLSFGRVPVRLPMHGHLGRIPAANGRGPCGLDSACLARPVSQGEDLFAQSLRDALARSASNDVLVFVHGYNFRFDEAVLWAAQLKHDVQFAGVVVLYSWPSRGSRWAYGADLANAEWTSPHLARFLDRLASLVGDGRVHLLAHSMGSKAAVYALHALAVERRTTPPPRLGQVILAAADLDAGVFGQLIPPVLAIADRVTLYTAADFALRISGWLFAHARAGDSRGPPVLLDGVDTVDVTSVDGGSAGHNYFLEDERVLADICQLLAHGAPPQRRFRLFGVQLQGLTVWQFRS